MYAYDTRILFFCDVRAYHTRILFVYGSNNDHHNIVINNCTGYVGLQQYTMHPRVNHY